MAHMFALLISKLKEKYFANKIRNTLLINMFSEQIQYRGWVSVKRVAEQPQTTRILVSTFSWLTWLYLWAIIRENNTERSHFLESNFAIWVLKKPEYIFRAI